MNPSQIIKDAQDKLAQIKGTVGVDPKWFNRTMSHLDNAYASSTLIIRKGSLADTPEAQRSDDKTCICPQGAVDSTCPVHRA